MKNAKHNVQANVNAGMKGLTGIIWPGSEEVLKPKSQNLRTHSVSFRHQDIVSSLPLQILLSNHWLLDLAFGLFAAGSLYYKFKFLPEQANLKLGNWQVITTLTGLIVWTITEVGRIYLGFAGNLLEQVPHLAGFFFLSVFPQLPILLWMIFLQQPIYDIDRILFLVQLAILVLEIIFGYWANRKIISAQTLRWRIEMRRREEAISPSQEVLEADIIRHPSRHNNGKPPNLSRIHPGYERNAEHIGKLASSVDPDQLASLLTRTNLGVSSDESRRPAALKLPEDRKIKLSMKNIVSSASAERGASTFLTRLKDHRNQNPLDTRPSGKLSFSDKLRRRKQSLREDNDKKKSSLPYELEMKKQL